MLKWLGKCKFWRDRRGVSVVEFALILPVQLVMIFGTVEISNLMIADRKLVAATSTTADLFTQVKTVTRTDVAYISLAGAAVMQPLNNGNLSFVVASIVADAGGVTKVEWSEGYAGAPLAAGANYVLPAGLVAPTPLTDRFILAPHRSVKVVHL